MFNAYRALCSGVLRVKKAPVAVAASIFYVFIAEDSNLCVLKGRFEVMVWITENFTTKFMCFLYIEIQISKLDANDKIIICC
jgi:hypothetical protein